MKRLLCLMFALLLLALPCALAETDPSAHVDEDGETIDNPMHDVDSFEALQAAVPGVVIARPPEDANTVTYTWIHAEPVIAQIQFIWGEDFYTYRAAALPDSGEKADIDGLYLPFDEEESFTNLFEGEEDVLRVRSSTEEAYAVCDWVRADLKTQYSLFSETAGEPEMPIIELAATLMPVQSAWAEDSDE